MVANFPTLHLIVTKRYPKLASMSLNVRKWARHITVIALV